MLHRPLAGGVTTTVVETDSGGVIAGIFQQVSGCGSLCVLARVQFDLRLRTTIRAHDPHE